MDALPGQEVSHPRSSCRPPVEPRRDSEKLAAPESGSPALGLGNSTPSAPIGTIGAPQLVREAVFRVPRWITRLATYVLVDFREAHSTKKTTGAELQTRRKGLECGDVQVVPTCL